MHSFCQTVLFVIALDQAWTDELVLFVIDCIPPEFSPFAEMENFI